MQHQGARYAAMQLGQVHLLCGGLPRSLSFRDRYRQAGAEHQRNGNGQGFGWFCSKRCEPTEVHVEEKCSEQGEGEKCTDQQIHLDLQAVAPSALQPRWPGSLSVLGRVTVPPRAGYDPFTASVHMQKPASASRSATEASGLVDGEHLRHVWLASRP